MAKKATTDTCCLTLPLIVEKWQADRLEKRLEIARQIYNTLVNYEHKKLRRLERQEEYIAIQNELQQLRENQGKESPEIKKLFRKLDSLRKESGFTEYGFKDDIKHFYKHFKDNIGSAVAVHGIAPQVWAAFDRLFYGNGKEVHFKKRGDLNSVRGYSVTGKSGGTEIIFRGRFIEWKGLKLAVKIDSDNAYETDMLTRRVKYCRILKRPGKHKNRWYVQLMLEGKPTVKCDSQSGSVLHPTGHGAVGLDIGPQTIAYVSEKEVGLLELADKVQKLDREKRLLQRKLDRSRRATNPDNYSENGMIKRGVKLTRNKSKNYQRIQHELAFMFYQESQTRKRQHIELANHLLSLGDRFYVEDMEWPSLTHRAKKTEISEKTGRFKRKKRFGKSVANKAPATLIRIMDQKLISLNMQSTIKVPTKLKASQYNHITNDYQKKELSQRWNNMQDGRRIQRDIYSAFLLQHTNTDLSGFDRDALDKDYEGFVKLHDKVIQELRSAPKTIASMGIVRTAI